MTSKNFYFIGEDVSSSKPVLVQPSWKLEELKRAVGLTMHVAQPLGKEDYRR